MMLIVAVELAAQVVAPAPGTVVVTPAAVEIAVTVLYAVAEAEQVSTVS